MATPRWDIKRERWQLNAQKDGKRRCFYSPREGKAGEREVKAKAKRWIEGEPDRVEWRFEKCWALYLEDVKARTSAANYNQIDKWGRLYVLPRLKNLKIGRIRRQDWQDCITQAKPINGGTLAKKSYANIRATIANFWRFAADAEMIEIIPNPLKLPTNARKGGKDILLPEQLMVLFQASAEWYINAWRLMAITGLRPGECYGLKKTDIKGGLIRVRRSINSDDIITDGKNANARRDIPLPTAAELLIMDQLERIEAAGVESEWLFPARDGDQPRPKTAYKAFCKFRDAHSITVPPYSLRHTFVSLNKEIDEATLKRIVGHTKDMDTYGVYDKAIDGELKRAADKIDSAIGRFIK